MLIRAKHRDLFLAQVDASGECWVWTGKVNDQGYGDFRVQARGYELAGAHRFAYALSRGDLPGRKHVLHLCDNRLCVRPSHLAVGDHADNMRDMARKGRAKNGTLKFPHEVIAEVRASVAAGEPVRAVARRTGVSRAHVRRIRDVKTRAPNRYGVPGSSECRHAVELDVACRRCETLYLEFRFYGGVEAPCLIGATDYGATLQIPARDVTPDNLARLMVEDRG